VRNLDVTETFDLTTNYGSIAQDIHRRKMLMQMEKLDIVSIARVYGIIYDP
jgi:hypothetical protein